MIRLQGLGEITMADFETWGCRLPKAAKPHRCWLCGDTIAKGDKYWRINGKAYNKPFSVPSCRPKCELLPETLDQNPHMRSQLWNLVYVP
jgi:hypothetical protein